MAYSDQTMLDVTQLAYTDWDAHYEVLRDLGVQPTVSEILHAGYELREEKLYKKSDGSLVYDAVTGYGSSRTKTIYRCLNGESECGGWKLESICNDEKGSGFYGVAFRDENAADAQGSNVIVGCRGSESFTDVHHLKTDWLEANIGLIRPGLTKQQKVEAAWLNGTQTGGAAVLGASSVTALVNDTTDGFYTSGHSLGGQLAENAALCCDENLHAHLKAAYSWDGPSETKEYYQRFGNRTQALRDAGVMHEYKWSFVGSIFETESLFVQTYIKTNDVITRDGKESKGALARVEKHDTCNVYLQNESVAKGSQGLFENAIGWLTSKVAQIPELRREQLYWAISGLIQTVILVMQHKKEAEKALKTTVKLLAGAILASFALNPAGTTAVLGALGAAFALIAVTVLLTGTLLASQWALENYVVPAVGEAMGQAMQKLADGIYGGVLELLDWAQLAAKEIEKIALIIKNAIMGFCENVRSWWSALWSRAGNSLTIDVDYLRQGVIAMQNALSQIDRLEQDLSRIIGACNEASQVDVLLNYTGQRLKAESVREILCCWKKGRIARYAAAVDRITDSYGTVKGNLMAQLDNI